MISLSLTASKVRGDRNPVFHSFVSGVCRLAPARPISNGPDGRWMSTYLVIGLASWHTTDTGPPRWASAPQPWRLEW